MTFIDETTLTVNSGDGGDGIVAWRRESHVPMGGPAGGDGGKGGDVVFIADPRLGTLLDLRYRKIISASRGVHGGQSNRHGANGDDAEIRVPVGTVISDADTGEDVVDLADPHQRWVAARGGRGGRGNSAFTTPVNRAPDYAEPGRKGESRNLHLTLKLLADIGIVGLPNAGKSSLIRRISNARPKVADYPFTTLTPNLGVVGFDDTSFVVADMPGLIEGAAEGVGLGTRFLRHVERTAALLLMVAPNLDDTPPDPIEALATVRMELERHDPELAQRPWIVALNKMDLPEAAHWQEPLARRCQELGVQFHPLSVATGGGVKPLIQSLARIVESARRTR